MLKFLELILFFLELSLKFLELLEKYPLRYCNQTIPDTETAPFNHKKRMCPMSLGQHPCFCL